MKKKYLNLALIYAIFAMIGGVFYREFTKFYHFTKVTTLGKVHTHLFILGTFVYLFVAIFSKNIELEKQKSFCIFMKIYNIGLPILSISMLVRGIIQVLEVEISNKISLFISGLAGLGHILVGIGLILFLIALKKGKQK